MNCFWMQFRWYTLMHDNYYKIDMSWLLFSQVFENSAILLIKSALVFAKHQGRWVRSQTFFFHPAGILFVQWWIRGGLWFCAPIWILARLPLHTHTPTHPSPSASNADRFFMHFIPLMVHRGWRGFWVNRSPEPFLPCCYVEGQTDEIGILSIKLKKR